MRTSKAGIEFIKKHEGLVLTAYRCQAGVLTIGFGHTGGVKPGQKITAQEAEQFLIEDLMVAEAAIKNFVLIPLEQNQYDALASFIFNVGVGAFKKSKLLVCINNNWMDEVEKQFMRWVYAAGKKSTGLKRRRVDEVVLFKGEWREK